MAVKVGQENKVLCCDKESSREKSRPIQWVQNVHEYKMFNEFKREASLVYLNVFLDLDVIMIMQYENDYVNNYVHP